MPRPSKDVTKRSVTSCGLQLAAGSNSYLQGSHRARLVHSASSLTIVVPDFNTLGNQRQIRISILMPIISNSYFGSGRFCHLSRPCCPSCDHLYLCIDLEPSRIMLMIFKSYFDIFCKWLHTLERHLICPLIWLSSLYALFAPSCSPMACVDITSL